MLFLPYVQILKLKFQFGSLVKTSYLGGCGRRTSEREFKTNMGGKYSKIPASKTNRKINFQSQGSVLTCKA